MTQTLLERVAHMGFADYDPGVIIAAVNELQPLGKQQALAQIDAYLQQHDTAHDGPGIFWLLRVLFDLPQGQRFPSVRLGQPTLAPPADADALPRFPIMLVNDVPLLVVQGYTLSGFPEPITDHVAFFRSHGVIRSAALAPLAQAAVVKTFRQQWQVAYGPADNPAIFAFIDTQLARLSGP